MLCKICKDHGLTGQWSTGTSNFRKKTVYDHLASKGHALSTAAKDPAQPTISKEVKRAEERRMKAVQLGMKACFWVANEELPNSKFKALLEFLRHLEIPKALNLFKSGNVKYDSADIFNQILRELSNTIEADLTTQLKSSPCVGVGIDESTDRSLEKHLVAVIRYITRKYTFKACLRYAMAVNITVLYSLYLTRAQVKASCKHNKLDQK